jgi:hypothetical protein
VRCHFHARPESGVTNSKNQKMRDLRVTLFYITLMWEKIQTLKKAIYQKVPSQK